MFFNRKTAIVHIVQFSVADSPRPILHKVLTTEDDQHVDAAVVEHPCPVL